MNTIPKIIHYCWFGPKEKSKDELKCIDSWKKHLPEYQIIEWNEKNFDIENSPIYVKQAYEAKKYAFVSDYVRIQALYEYGGLYFDTDLEVLSSFEEHLEGNSLVLNFESERLLMTAFIAVEKNHTFIKEFLDTYKDRTFILEDGSYDTTPNTDIWSPQAESWGVDLDRNEIQEIVDKRIKVFPIEVFCGFDVKNWHEKVTKQTKCIHRMAFSWVETDNKTVSINRRLLQKVLGYKIYDFLKENIYNKIKKLCSR